MRRKYQIFAAVVVLLLVAGDVAYWRIAADRVRGGLSKLAGRAGCSGLAGFVRAADDRGMASGGLGRGAEPDAAAHRTRRFPATWRVASADVMLSVSLFSPATLRASMTGPAHVRVAGLQDVVLTADEDWVSVPLLTSGSHAVDLFASGLRVEPATGAWHATTGLLNVHATIADKPKVEQSEQAATFSVSAEAIALPAVIKWPLGTNISSLSLDGVLNGRCRSSLEMSPAGRRPGGMAAGRWRSPISRWGGDRWG